MPATKTRAKPKARTAAKRPAKRTTPKAKPKATLPKITVEDLADFNESINLLIYGDSGVGKTVLAGGAPDAVFISTEKGTIAAKRAGSKAKLIRATSWESLEAAIQYIEEDPSRFKWVILDSLTKMQVLLIRYILKKINEENESRDLDIPAIQDHQKWQNMFKRFVDRLVDLEVNVIFTATAMHKEDDEGDPLTLPDIQGKDYAISQYVCAAMDSVFALVVKKKKSGEKIRNLITQTTPPYFAKDRYDSTENDFITLGQRDPENMANIIAAIEESDEFEAIQKGKKKSSKKPKPVDLDEDEDDDDDDLEDDDEDADEEGEDESADDDDDGDEDDDEGDDDSEDEDEEEDEQPSKARSRKTRGKTPAKRPQARRGQRRAVANPADDEDDADEEDEEPTRKAGKAKTSRRPARKAASPRKAGKAAKSKAADDDDDFDPDDGDEVEFDDDED